MEDRAWTDSDEAKAKIEKRLDGVVCAVDDLKSALESEMIKLMIGSRPWFFRKSKWDEEEAELRNMFSRERKSSLFIKGRA